MNISVQLHRNTQRYLEPSQAKEGFSVQGNVYFDPLECLSHIQRNEFKIRSCAFKQETQMPRPAPSEVGSPLVSPVFSGMEMGILPSVSLTLWQLNHLYVIRWSDGEAVCALTKRFLRVIFPSSFFFQLRALRQVIGETRPVSAAMPRRTVSHPILLSKSPG